MNVNRLRWGDWIAAIAALNLLLVTFRGWYKLSGGDARVTAWHALEQGKYLLIATAVAGIFLFLVKAAGESEKLSFKPGWVAAVVGLACTVYIAYRLAKPPSDALEATLGIYLGLLSALGVTIGGLLSARESAAAEPATEGASQGSARATATAVPAADSDGAWTPAAPVASTNGWSPASPPAAGGPMAAPELGSRPEAGDSWSPAMPAAARDEPLNGTDAEAPRSGADTDETPTDKVPWWKREIGGGKKKKRGAAELGAAAAVGAAAANVGDSNASTEPKPGFVKRMFGRGNVEPATPTAPEAEPTPVTDVAGTGPAAEADTAVAEAPAESGVDDAPVEAPADAVDSTPAASDPAPEPTPVPVPADEPAAAGSEPPAPTQPTGADSEPAASPPSPTDAAIAAAAAPAANGHDEQPEPARKGSSGTRAIPNEVVAALQRQTQPKIGDEVQLKFGGGRFGAGTRGTVVDVFSAGVIVEMSGEGGRSERLDLPFEAIGPADV